MSSVTRRNFIKIGAGGAAVAAVGSGLVTEWWGHDRYTPEDPGTDGDRVVPTFCDICFWKCGALAHVREGQVTKITGNPRHPISRGRLCPRGLGGTGLLYDPDRLRQPLVRRRGRRGSDDFEEVSWDQALDRVAEGMTRIRERHGAHAMAMFYHGLGGGWFKPLLHEYGTANIAAPSYAQCRGPREEGYRVTIGRAMNSPEPIDIRNARCMVLIGAHLGENMHNTQVQDFADALDDGMDLVVVDPRHSVAASKARYWLPIKPGTDTALLLAWMHIVVTEGLYDRQYIEQHTVGFDRLEAHVRDKTPEWAAVRTGLSADLIRSSGRLIASHRPASLIHPGRRATWYGDDTQRARAMAMLAGLLGSFGRRGGYLQPTKMRVPPYPIPSFATEPRDPADHPRGTAYPLATSVLAHGLRDASIAGTADYDIKGWLVYGTNLLQSIPNPERTRQAIQRLELIVSVDVLPSEICGWSDVVLPECTYLERYDDLWSPSYEQPFVALRQPVVEPMYQSRPGSWIARELARRLDLQRFYPWDDAEAYLQRRARDASLDWAALTRDGVVTGERQPVCEEEGLQPSFSTPSEKIELYSEALAAMGADPMPEFRMPPQPEPGQLRLITGRSPVHSFGRTINNRFLSTVDDTNEAWLNPRAARALPGFESAPLQTGDQVVLINQDDVRSEPLPVRITERLRGDVVYVTHGFGHTARGLTYARGRGASTSELSTRLEHDPLMGSPGYNVNFVRVELAGSSAEGQEA